MIRRYSSFPSQLLQLNVQSNVLSSGKARLFTKQSPNITDVTDGTHPRVLTAGRSPFRSKHPPPFSIFTSQVRDSNQPSNRWNFAREHHIRLVDEFDQINFDIEPLLAVPPSMLHARHRTLKKEMEDWGFHIRVENGKPVLKVVNTETHLAPRILRGLSLASPASYQTSNSVLAITTVVAESSLQTCVSMPMLQFLKRRVRWCFADASISLTSSTALTEQELKILRGYKETPPIVEDSFTHVHLIPLPSTCWQQRRYLL
jgi:hypothetical protein